MKKIVINNDNRRFNISSIVVGYLEENKEEVLEFEIPEKYAEYGKKACFIANGQTFAKNFDDIISNKLTITRDISQFKELDMTIEFFKIENEDEIVARTSILHILIENAIICDDDIKPDEPKIIILDNLIDEVTKLDVLVTKNEEKREEYYQEIQEKVDNGDFNGATFTPSVDTDGNISWSNDKNLSNPTTQNIKGPKGEKGDTYNLTEQDKEDISSMTVESSESAFNQYYNDKLKDFNSNATSKTNDFDTNTETKTEQFNSNYTSKVQSFNENSTSKTNDYNTNATTKTTEFNTNADAKLQEYNTNADNKIAEYDLHSQELDNKIIDTRNELERVKNDVLETGTDTDTFIHLEDSAMAEYQKLSVDGVCKQNNSLYFGLIEQGAISEGINTDSQNRVRTSDYTTVKPNTSINIYANGADDCLVSLFDINKNFIGNYGYASLGKTIAIPNNVYYLRVTLRKTDGSNISPLNISDFKVGNVPNPDYPQPISTIENSLKITSCNKNLFDYLNLIFGYIDAQGQESGTTEKGNILTDFIKVENNKSYTISLNTQFSNIGYALFDSNKTYVSRKNNANKTNITITIPSGISYIRIWFNHGVTFTNLEDILTYQPMIEQEIQATPYEQHLENQITANLPEGEFIGKINDTYKDTLKVEYNEEDGQYHLNLYKSVGKFVLDGSNNAFIQKSGTTDNVIWMTNNVFNVSNYVNVMSNYFIGYTNAYLYNHDGLGIYLENKRIKCAFGKNTDLTTLELANQWLSTHNVEVYYQLATPYVVDLGVVDQLITYNEVTNLFTDSDLMPTINAKYYRNFITTIQNLQVNEKALKQELVDINARLSALESASLNVVSESEVIE